MTDYIMLPRSALDMVKDAPLWQLYGYILSKADENGEWTVSLKEVRADLGLSRQRFRTLLGRLKSTTKSTTNLTTKSTTKSTTVTLNISSNKYNLSTTKLTTKSTTKSTTKFTPPTREEAQSYIDKMNFHWGNADMFIDWYESRGWTVGNQPMKDWKAAMRTWENRWMQMQNNNESRYENRYVSRRGADVEALTESDYGGSF